MSLKLNEKLLTFRREALSHGLTIEMQDPSHLRITFSNDVPSESADPIFDLNQLSETWTLKALELGLKVVANASTLIISAN